MSYIERLAAAFLFRVKMQDLFEDEFEHFFQKVMVFTDNSFIDVRPAGRMGDEGADGLLLVGGKLYASYAPEQFRYQSVVDKLMGDLDKAKTKRAGQFTTFVFVHNDTRGVHAAVSMALGQAAGDNPGIRFERIGPRDLLRRLHSLDRTDVEALLEQELPVEDMTYGVGIEDLTPILEHLRSAVVPRQAAAVLPVSARKLEWNGIEDELRASFVHALKSTHKVEQYYDQLRDPAVRDGVAAELRREYNELAQVMQDPEEIIWSLEQFIAGNALRKTSEAAGVQVILAHFFETCDIFEDAPEGWEGGSDYRDIAN